MPIKLFCIFIILISSYFFGYSYVYKIKTKEKEITGLICLLYEIKNQIFVFSVEIENILYNSFNVKKTDELINKIQNNLLYKSFSDKEKKEFIDFIENLGKSDKNIEVQKCENCINQFNIYLEDTRKILNEKSKLYNTLSISFGVIISIVII